MSQYATATRPYDPHALFGAGPSDHGHAGVGVPRLSMWHPELPEVDVFHSRGPLVTISQAPSGDFVLVTLPTQPFWSPRLPKVQTVPGIGVFAMTTEAVTPSWPFGAWRKVSSLEPKTPFWHPALPEVYVTDGGRRVSWSGGAVMAPAVSCRVPGAAWRSVICHGDPLRCEPVNIVPSPDARMLARVYSVAIFLSLLLPLAAHAEPEKAPCAVNVQTCNVAQCALLPGIGMAKGAAIAQAHPANEAELDSVKGIGPATLEEIRPFVVYGDVPTTCTSKQTAPKPEAGKDGAQ